jgi:hypothetical protein
MMVDQLLSDKHIGCFKKDGFLLVPGMFGEGEMEEITKWTDEIASSPEVPGKFMMYFEESLTTKGKRILSRIENFCAFHDGFNQLVNHSKLKHACEELLGEQVVLFKDKINFKLAGASGFTPHQDVQAGWDKYANFHLTAMISIDPATIENGCLELVAGYHNKGLIGKKWEPLSESDVGDLPFKPYPTQPGDAVFFDSFAPHQSAPNKRDQLRRVLYITYNKLSEGDHLAQYYADKRLSYPPDCERDPNKTYTFKV